MGCHGVVGRSQWLHEYLEDVRLDSRARPGSAQDTGPTPTPPESGLPQTRTTDVTAPPHRSVHEHSQGTQRTWDDAIKKAKMNASAPGRKLALCVPESPHRKCTVCECSGYGLRRLLFRLGQHWASDVRTYPTLSDTLKHVETSVQDKFRRRIWWRGTSGLQQRSHGLSARGIDGEVCGLAMESCNALVSEVLDPLRPLAFGTHTQHPTLAPRCA